MATGRYSFLRVAIPIVLIAYVLFSGIAVSNGISYIQEWSIDMTADTVEAFTPEPGWIPFVLKDYFGYIQPDGEELYKVAVQDDVSFAQKTYINFEKLGNNLVIHDAMHKYLYPIDYVGYPIGMDDLYLILMPDMTGFAAFATSGEILFERSFTSLISSIDYNGEIISVGLLKGENCLFDREGRNIDVIEITGSRINPVYGTSVSPDGNTVVMVHGLDPQFTSLYQKQGTSYIRLKRFIRENEMRSQVLIDFSDDSQLCMVETSEGVCLYDMSEPFDSRTIDFSGELIDFELPSRGEPLYFLCSDGSRSFLELYRQDGRLFSREEMDGRATWLFRKEKAVYFGFENTLVKASMEIPGR